VSDPEKPEGGSPAVADPPEGGLQPVEPDPAATVEARLAELQAEVAALKDQLLRRRADFENFRRRAERERGNAWAEASAEIVKALVPTLDNLERAVSAEGDDVSVREGVALIRRELMTALEARGLGVDDPTGKPFDPERHQALSHDEAPGLAPGTVVETFRKGYVFKDRLVRPALVKVAKAVDPSDEQAKETWH
jgi:molecular chaperone GrpE